MVMLVRLVKMNREEIGVVDISRTRRRYPVAVPSLGGSHVTRGLTPTPETSPMRPFTAICSGGLITGRIGPARSFAAGPSMPISDPRLVGPDGGVTGVRVLKTTRTPSAHSLIFGSSTSAGGTE